MPSCDCAADRPVRAQEYSSWPSFRRLCSFSCHWNQKRLVTGNYLRVQKRWRVWATSIEVIQVQRMGSQMVGVSSTSGWASGSAVRYQALSRDQWGDQGCMLPAMVACSLSFSPSFVIFRPSSSNPFSIVEFGGSSTNRGNNRLSAG